MKVSVNKISRQIELREIMPGEAFFHYGQYYIKAHVANGLARCFRATEGSEAKKLYCLTLSEDVKVTPLTIDSITFGEK